MVGFVGRSRAILSLRRSLTEQTLRKRIWHTTTWIHFEKAPEDLVLVCRSYPSFLSLLRGAIFATIFALLSAQALKSTLVNSAPIDGWLMLLTPLIGLLVIFMIQRLAVDEHDHHHLVRLVHLAITGNPALTASRANDLFS